jgi:hypothetical protein
MQRLFAQILTVNGEWIERVEEWPVAAEQQLVEIRSAVRI